MDGIKTCRFDCGAQFPNFDLRDEHEMRIHHLANNVSIVYLYILSVYYVCLIIKIYCIILNFILGFKCFKSIACF